MPINQLRFILLAVACFLTGSVQPLLADEPNPFKPATAPAVHRPFVYAVGTVEPEDAVDIGAAVAGTVSKVFVNFNSVVRKGELLAQIDDPAYAVRLNMAKASLQQAHANMALKEADYRFQAKSLERIKALVGNGAVTNEALDVQQLHCDSARAALAGAEAEVSLREAAVQLAMLDLAATKIISPVDGIVIDRRVTEGQTVSQSTPAGLFLIAKDLHRMQLWISVNEKDIARVRPGQDVQFRLDAFKNDVFTGKVTKVRLNAAMNHNIVTYTVEVGFENSDGRVLPYMTADAQIAVGQERERK